MIASTVPASMNLCALQLWVTPSHSSFTCVRSPHLRSKSYSHGQTNPPRAAVAMAFAGADVVEDGKALLGLLLQIVDPWAPTVSGGININSQSLASQLFAASLFPYLGFLYHLTRSNSSPKLTLFGFYFLLAFVAATSE
ncbi:hypothetical protein L7F22_015808 [Adiantum nelumboides]|nr:hypothetical protein [Adiantum nelumboides]